MKTLNDLLNELYELYKIDQALKEKIHYKQAELNNFITNLNT